MKILQIIQRPQLRGAEIFACQLSEELNQLGHKTDVVYLFGNNNNHLDYNLNFTALGAIQKKRFWDFKAYQRLKKIIAEGRYDLVQANAGDTLKYAAISKLLFKWKTPLIFRNANSMSRFIRNTLHKKLNQFFLSQADFHISVSENCRQDLIKLHPQLREMSEVGTIGTYLYNEFLPFKKPDNGFIWINIGSFVPEKNHWFLIELFEKYHSKFKNGELWLIGDGELRKSLEEQVKKNGLEGKVKFLGYRNDVISLLKAADIMVMPSVIEGLPGVILEAQSVGVPVVAADVGGISEVIESGNTGFCVQEYDVERYLDYIERLLTDEELYNKIKVEGRRQVEEKFLMPKIAHRFLMIYEELLSNKKG